MIKRLTFISLLLFAVLSCVYPYDTSLTSSDEFIPVFDGSIIIGDRATLSVTRMVDLDGDYSKGFTGSDVLAFTWWVEDDSGKKYLPTVSKPSEINLVSASPLRQYKIHAEVAGKTYESPLQTVPDSPVIDDITFWADEKTVFVGASVSENAGSTGYIAFTFEETWEFHVDYVPEYSIDEETLEMEEVGDGRVGHYYCWKYSGSLSDKVADVSIIDGSITAYPFHSFARIDNRNHRKYSINVFVRYIQEDEYRFRKHLDQQKEGGNDLFNPNPGEMIGNIACTDDSKQRVLGFISVSQAASKRVFLDNRYQIVKEINDAYLIIVPTEEYRAYYDSGYRPIKQTVDFEGNIGIGWGPLRCIDCTYDGGTLERPDFWEGQGGNEQNKPGEAEK